jgi:DNA polymerase III gamma/tau subunit
MFILANALYTRDIDTVLYVIDKLYNSGADLKSFIELFLEFALDLSKYSIFKTMNVVNIPVYLEGNVKGITEAIEDRAWYAKLIDAVLNIKLEIKYDSSYKSTIEALLLRFCKA